MLNKTKAGKILKGVRGEKPADINKLKEIILSASRMMIDNPEIKEFDFNPLILDEQNKFYAVDVRVKI
jgi:acyl-CoA synthetase (NDP forming)